MSGKAVLPAVPGRIRTAGLAALAAILASVLAGLAGKASAKPAHVVTGPTPIEVTTLAIDRFRIGGDAQRFGALQFRGGLVLRSANPAFGGISGLSIDPDGERFLAVSDAGVWISGRFTTRAGRLTGVDSAMIAPIRAADGTALADDGREDVESVSADADRAFIGIEGVNEIWSFPLAGGVPGGGRRIGVPAEARRLPGNAGFEAIALSRPGSPLAGALVAISERSGAMDAPTRGFILGGPRRGSFLVRRSDEFDVTDAAFLPNGDLLILERRASLARGFGMRLRRLPGDAIRPGALVDGPVLLEAGLESQIDNMEALAVATGPSGETLVTLMSDDNFAFFQRSIVLRFAITARDAD